MLLEDDYEQWPERRRNGMTMECLLKDSEKKRGNQSGESVL
jgi:hypothetical protein